MVTLKTFCVLSHEQDNKPTKDKVAKPNVDFANLKMYEAVRTIKGDKNYNIQEVLTPTITLKAQQNNSDMPQKFYKGNVQNYVYLLDFVFCRQGWQTTILI